MLNGSVTFMLRALVASLILGALWHVLAAAQIYGKAWIAQTLLEKAWNQTLTGPSQVKPWPWADFWPVAKLTMLRLDVEQIVLAGDSGNVLAFAPGYNEASAKIGEIGISLVGGHRDTHFRFLEDLVTGDELIIQTSTAQIIYVVERTEVVDERDYFVPAALDLNSDTLASGNDAQLILSTCYPFDALVPSSSRFIVLAKQKRSTEKND